MLLRTVES